MLSLSLFLSLSRQKEKEGVGIPQMGKEHVPEYERWWCGSILKAHETIHDFFFELRAVVL